MQMVARLLTNPFVLLSWNLPDLHLLFFDKKNTKHCRNSFAWNVIRGQHRRNWRMMTSHSVLLQPKPLRHDQNNGHLNGQLEKRYFCCAYTGLSWKWNGSPETVSISVKLKDEWGQIMHLEDECADIILRNNGKAIWVFGYINKYIYI
jgi:hypothetical protein